MFVLLDFALEARLLVHLHCCACPCSSWYTPSVTILQGEFNALAGELGRQYPDRARLWFAYDEPLSHLIYAGKPIYS